MGYIVLIALGILLDQISKYMAVNNLKYLQSKTFIPGFMDFTLTKNTGASFSLFNEHTLYLTVFSIVFVVVICVFWRKIKKRNSIFLLNLSFAMILSGAIGNIIDRVRLGYVVDFFEFTFVKFAIFNVADCFITIGAILFCFLLVFNKKIEI